MSFVSRNEHYENVVRACLSGQPFTNMVGASIVHLAPGEVDLACDWRDDLTQQHGYFHAGVTSGMADTSAGFAALSLFEPNREVLTTEFKINLVAPGLGAQMIARGRVIKPGRTLTACKSDVFAKTGEKETLIATGLFTMMQLAPR